MPSDFPLLRGNAKAVNVEAPSNPVNLPQRNGMAAFHGLGEAREQPRFRPPGRHLRPRKRSAILALRSQYPLCDNRKFPFAQPWSQARDIVLFGV